MFTKYKAFQCFMGKTKAVSFISWLFAFLNLFPHPLTQKEQSHMKFAKNWRLNIDPLIKRLKVNFNGGGAVLGRLC